MKALLFEFLGYVLGLLLLGYALAQGQPLATLHPGQAVRLGPYTCTQADLQFPCTARLLSESSMVYVPARDTVCMWGGGHSQTSRTDVECLTLSTGQWTSEQATTSCADITTWAQTLDVPGGFWKPTGHPMAMHTYMNLLVYPPTGEMLVTTNNRFNSCDCLGCSWTYPAPGFAGGFPHYNFTTKQWTHGSQNYGLPYTSASAYDPQSQLVLIAYFANYDFHLRLYDPRTRSVTAVAMANVRFNGMVHYTDTLVYFPPNDTFYYVTRSYPTTGSTRVYALTFNRTTPTASTVVAVPMTNSLESGEYGWVYEPQTQTIQGAVENSTIKILDPVTKTFRTQTIASVTAGQQVGTQHFHQIAYHPTEQVILLMASNATWAYRPGGGTVPPPDPQPGPTPPPPVLAAMPDLTQEKAAYQRWGWAWQASQEPNLPTPYPGEPARAYAVSDPDIHGDTEGDDLWTYLMMYSRTGQAGYYERAKAWAIYYRDGYQQCTGDPYRTYCYDRDAFGLDHVVTYGLVAWYGYTQDATFLQAAERIAGDIEALYADPKYVPGYPMMYYGARGSARHLMSLTALASATQAPRWIALRDKLLALWQASPDWDAQQGMYFVSEWQQDTQYLSPGSYVAGLRGVAPFQLGILAEAFMVAYKATQAPWLKSRLAVMATWAQRNGLDPATGYASSFQFVNLATGVPGGKYTYHGQPLQGQEYTTSLVGLLTMGYILSGDGTLLTSASDFLRRGTLAPTGQVGHFIDTIWDTSQGKFYLAYNRGELLYTYRLFANGGQPPLDGIPPTCVPDCTGKCGQPDGCGGTCAACPPSPTVGLQCAPVAVRVPALPPPQTFTLTLPCRTTP